MLFDLLLADENQQKINEFESVRAHLMRLLNTRRCDLYHLPGFGLPDKVFRAQHIPNSNCNLSDVVKNLITQYETRLKNIDVRTVVLNEKNCMAHLEITGSLRSDLPVRMQTYFYGVGPVEIS